MSERTTNLERDTQENELPLGVDTTSEGGQNEQENDEGVDRESTRETVERVYKEAQEKAKKESSGEKLEAKPEKQTNGLVKEEDIRPPQRLTAEEKELFHKAPPELKKALANMFNNHEAAFTKGRQEQARAEQEAKHVVEAVRPYLLSNPHLAERGYTESRIVSELIATHQKLTDPKTGVDTWLRIGTQIGLDPSTIEAIKETVGVGSRNSEGADISSHPQFQALQEKINALESYYGQQQNMQVQQTLQSVVSEMEAVKEEMDANGRYVYPKLHDQSFLERVKPLVSAIVQTTPEVGYGEALKRAYRTIEGDSSQSYQAKVPTAQNNNDINKRAAQAAVSVRGKVPPSMTPSSMDEIPKEALGSARDSVKWALAQLKKG
jgi:hypothetical protein